MRQARAKVESLAPPRPPIARAAAAAAATLRLQSMEALTHFANAADAANMLEIGAAAGAGAVADVMKARGGSITGEDRARLLPPGVPTSTDDGGGSALEAVGQKFVEWARDHPRSMKALAVCGEVLSVGLLFADLISDVVLMAALFGAQAWVFGTLSAFLLVNQYVAMDKGIHAFVTRRASDNVQMAHLMLGFPAAPLVLDVMMALKALGLLDGWLSKETEALLSQYKSTRALLEVTLESAPQTVLQMAVFGAVLFGDDGQGGGGAAVLQVSTSALLTSLTLSVISLVKSWLVAWLSSRALELTVAEYLGLLLSMGKGVPLEDLRSNALDELKLDGLPMDRFIVKVMATVLRKENTTLKVLDLSGSLVEPRAAETRALADAIARHPTLQSVTLDGATLDGFHELRVNDEINLRAREGVGAPATVKLLAGLAAANPRLRKLNLKGVELDAEAREQLRESVRGREVQLLMDESVAEAASEARAALLLKKVGMDADALASATALDWSGKDLTAADAQIIAKDVLLRFPAVTALKCARALVALLFMRLTAQPCRACRVSLPFCQHALTPRCAPCLQCRLQQVG